MHPTAESIHPDKKEKDLIFYSGKYDNNHVRTGLNIDHLKLTDLLYSFGFRRFDLDGTYIFVRIKDQIVSEVQVTNIQDELITYIKNLPPVLNEGIRRDELLTKFYTSPGFYFNDTKLTLLRPEKPIIFNQDTKDACFIYFKNGFVKCTKEGYRLLNYSELENLVGSEQIKNRDFEYREQEDRSIESKGMFARFCYNISFQDPERFEALCTMIGYLLHSYYDTKLKAIALTDSQGAEQAEGRTGKSLIGVAINHIKDLCDIPGKDFDPNKPFKFQRVSITTQVVFFNDVKKEFKIESLYNAITDGIVVERKNKQPFSVKTKIFISSNKTLTIEGASSRDRVVEFELSDYYKEGSGPDRLFAEEIYGAGTTERIWFFSKDWTTEDWIEFYNFMIHCISIYFKNGGIKEVPPKNLERRKLLNETKEEFVEFMDERFENGHLLLDIEYNKKWLHEEFLNEYPDFKEDRFLKKQSTFTKYLNKYAKYTKSISGTTERKSGSERFITFLSDHQQELPF